MNCPGSGSVLSFCNSITTTSAYLPTMFATQNSMTFLGPCDSFALLECLPSQSIFVKSFAESNDTSLFFLFVSVCLFWEKESLRSPGRLQPYGLPASGSQMPGYGGTPPLPPSNLTSVPSCISFFRPKMLRACDTIQPKIFHFVDWEIKWNLVSRVYKRLLRVCDQKNTKTRFCDWQVYFLMVSNPSPPCKGYVGEDADSPVVRFCGLEKNRRKYKKKTFVL